MKNKVISILFAAGTAWLIWASLASDGQALYQEDFQKAPLGQVPEAIMVLDGQFSVKQEGTNKFLELPGAPVEAFGAVFGPTRKDGTAVAARIFSTRKGRRFPAFGVGLNGWGGYRLQVTPAKGQLELFKGDQLVGSVAYPWESGRWTECLLQVRKTEQAGWKVEAAVWSETREKLSKWTLEWTDASEPKAGRASLFASPFSGEVIRFDDLEVRPATDKP